MMAEYRTIVLPTVVSSSPVRKPCYTTLNHDITGAAKEGSTPINVVTTDMG